MRPVTTEKAVRLIELQNTLIFEVDRREGKTALKKEIEEAFNVKIASINTLIRLNKKYAYVRLDAKNPAIDVATKLGMI
ncbi:MAG: 50S ribosomal protein L23 [Nanoarchaeota archaeon]